MKTTGVECTLKKRLPEGVYAGYWGGYDVTVNHNGEQWNIRTKDGIRGINTPVSVVVTEKLISIVRVKKVEHAVSIMGRGRENALSLVDVRLDK